MTPTATERATACAAPDVSSRTSSAPTVRRMTGTSPRAYHATRLACQTGLWEGGRRPGHERTRSILEARRASLPARRDRLLEVLGRQPHEELVAVLEVDRRCEAARLEV